jgi:hypothetical protein
MASVFPTDPALGKLERMDPRLVWKHEAHNFTPWLALNADRLAEALGIDLEILDDGVEHPVGGFSLDLLGRDITHDKPLIIENQLAGSDHGHLGQLLTYAAGTGASTIVWIATSIRDEHRQALNWLNEQTGEETHFFGVELEVVKIGSSLPAPLFNVVVLPNDWQKSVKAATASSAAGGGKALVYGGFWEKFLNAVKATRPQWSRAKQPPRGNWFPMSIGAPPGMALTASFTGDGHLRYELYIDRPTPEECKAAFDQVFEQREAFESAYGRVLSWDRLDNRKASRVADYLDGVVEEHERHDEFVDWFLDCGDRMRKALSSVTIA